MGKDAAGRSDSVLINPPIICTDDGWVLEFATADSLLQDIRDKVIGAYADCPVALWWSVGDHDIYTHETEIGEIVGDYALKHDPCAAVEPAAVNVRHLIDTSGGPLNSLIPMCRQAGIPFFPRVRMNSHYDIEPSDPLWSQIRRDHPEWCIGLHDPDYPVGSIEHGIRTGFDFRHAPVRKYRAQIICELFDRFDVDGVELDFMRHPAFFRVDEAYQHRHLMTDLVRHVRRKMERTAGVRGRSIQLAVRVPPTLADSVRIGLDVACWMQERLVDIVVCGGGFIPYETPIAEFVRAGGGDIDVYGCIESTRYADERNLSAITAHFLDSGARGVQLYNFYTKGSEWNRRVLNQLADRTALAHSNKRYELDQTARFTTPYHCAYPVHNIEATFRYGNPAAQLPMALESTMGGTGVELVLNVVDDVSAAAVDLATCRLSFRLDGLAPDDQLRVNLNGVELAWETASVTFDGWMRQEIEAFFWTVYPAKTVEAWRDGVSVEWMLDADALAIGDNRLQVALVVEKPRDKPVVVTGVELLLEYEGEK